jgi:hypothetical protein
MMAERMLRRHRKPPLLRGASEQTGEGHLFNRLIFAIRYDGDGPGIPPFRRAPGNLERKQRRLFVRDQL